MMNGLGTKSINFLERTSQVNFFFQNQSIYSINKLTPPIPRHKQDNLVLQKNSIENVQSSLLKSPLFKL